MGYDMYWRRKDDADVAAYRDAEAEWHEAIRIRDAFPRGSFQVDWSTDEITGPDPAAVAAARHAADLFVAMCYAEQYYFQLNVWGMSRYRDAMISLGMVCCPAGQRLDWPDEGDFGISYEDVEAVDYPDERGPRSPELHEKARQYAAARDRKLAEHPGECPGIPVWKFGSNDGWIVTPAECEAALRIYEGADRDVVEKALTDAGIEDADYWNRWLTFIRGAITHDGFEVN